MTMDSRRKWMNGMTLTRDVEIKIVEKIEENGKTAYGVRYKDGHISWFQSLPEASFAYSKATRQFKRKKKGR
jgi:hypothetical protein